MKAFISLLLFAALAAPSGDVGAQSLGADYSCSMAEQIHSGEWNVRGGRPDATQDVVPMAALAAPPVDGPKGTDRVLRVGAALARTRRVAPALPAAPLLRAHAPGAPGAPLRLALTGFRAHPSTAPPTTA